MVRSILVALFRNRLGDILQQHHNDILVHQKRHLDIVDSFHGDIAVHIDIHIRVFCCTLLYKCDIHHRCSIDLKIRMRHGHGSTDQNRSVKDQVVRSDLEIKKTKSWPKAYIFSEIDLGPDQDRKFLRNPRQARADTNHKVRQNHPSHRWHYYLGNK